jgi:purine-binding chemotaxis protein CheW
MNSITKEKIPKTKIVDWTDIHTKIEQAQSIIEKGWVPSQEQKYNILQARAKLYAEESKKKEMKEDYRSILFFNLAYETYGIELEYIREVYPLKELTPIPTSSNHILGIINVRGKILSVVDIRKFFDLPEKGLTDLNKVIILQSDELEFGILADSIIGVREIELNKLQPSLPTLIDIREKYLKGVTNDRITILDGMKILSGKKMVIHEEA